MAKSNSVHLEMTISGRVQGVGFRYRAKEAADKLGLVGYARNLSGGNVFLEVEGSEADIQKFRVWCQQGSDHARVDHVHVTHGDLKGYREFLIY